jgi:hypothetical protein
MTPSMFPIENNIVKMDGNDQNVSFIMFDIWNISLLFSHICIGLCVMLFYQFIIIVLYGAYHLSKYVISIPIASFITLSVITLGDMRNYNGLEYSLKVKK